MVDSPQDMLLYSRVYEIDRVKIERERESVCVCVKKREREILLIAVMAVED